MSQVTHSLHLSEHGDRPWPEPAPRRVFCDASQCTALTLELPPMSATRLNQALRWAAEEHLAGSAEHDHVVAGPRDDQGRLCALVISAEAMQQLTAHWPTGQGPDVMVPDALCLPWQPGQLSLGEVAGRVLARWGEWTFGSFEPELAADLLTPFDTLDWHWYGGAVPETLAAHALQRMTPKDSSDGLLLSHLDATAELLEVNLLTGPWASAAQLRGRHQWRWVAGLALGLLLVLSVSVGIENHLLQRQSADLQARIDQKFAAMFPGISPAGRHRQLAEREWAKLQFGQAAGLLDLLAQVTPVISALALDVQALNYRDGRLDVAVRALDVATLDDLEQRLRSLGLRAALQSASLDDEGASGQLQVSAGGSP